MVGSPKVEQWGIEEISIQSQQHYDNPFKDVQLQGRFTSQGQTIQVSGFYDGKQTWRIRFMPLEVGKWTFTTVSNDPHLNSQSGSFVVAKPSLQNHGPVRVAKTFHFSYADQTPYFLLGTTLYNWLNRDETLQTQTLQTLSKSPFNKVRFGLFPKWYEFNRVEPAAYPYVENGPLKFDLERFNPEFFQHVEKRLEDLQRLHVIPVDTGPSDDLQANPSNREDAPSPAKGSKSSQLAFILPNEVGGQILRLLLHDEDLDRLSDVLDVGPWLRINFPPQLVLDVAP